MPREARTVTSVRHLLRQGLVGIGVIDDCRDDILLAVTEACSNAVEHARSATEYYVVATVDRELCVVEVIDRGVGADPARLGTVSQRTAQRGRGLHIIRAVTDALELHSVDPQGLAVRMTKKLGWVRGAPADWSRAHPEPWVSDLGVADRPGVQDCRRLRM